MEFRGKGQAAPGFHVLGSAEVPAYLLEAPKPVLFDAGFACLGPAYIADACRVLGGRRPAWLCITHMHFDHCGAASQLQKAFGLTVAASAEAAQIIERPGAQKTIAFLNRDAARQAALYGVANGADLPEFKPFSVDRLLADGDYLDLGGGLGFRVLATPGHTRDFLSYFEPHKKILIASEAAGCADSTGYVITEFLVDYQAYLRNLERLAGLDAQVLCQGHHLVYTGPDVRAFLQRSLKAARDYKLWVDHLLDEEHGEVRRVMARVKSEEYDPRPMPKQPEAAYLLNLEARVRHLASLHQPTAGGVAGRIREAFKS